MENLMQPTPPAIVAEAPMTVEQFTEAVKHAATQLQSGIMQVWQLGQRAVKMAYGGSEYAEGYTLALLNNLPADAARQTHDWLKRAGINVNRPIVGSKLYWLSGTTRKIDGKDVVLITAKKPGEEGYGLTAEKALLFVKTTPPMAIERKEGKAKTARVPEGLIKDRARDAVVKTQKRLTKTDADAAKFLNDFISTMDDRVGVFYDDLGQRQKLDTPEVKLVQALLKGIATKSIPLTTLQLILSGDVDLVVNKEGEQQG